MDKKQMMMYAFLAIGVFLLAAPAQYQAMIPLPIQYSSTRQMLAVVALLAAYYYYNNEKLF